MCHRTRDEVQRCSKSTLEGSRALGRDKNGPMADKPDRKFEPGTAAPAFTLPDQDDKTVKL